MRSLLWNLTLTDTSNLESLNIKLLQIFEISRNESKPMLPTPAFWCCRTSVQVIKVKNYLSYILPKQHPCVVPLHLWRHNTERLKNFLQWLDIPIFYWLSFPTCCFSFQNLWLSQKNVWFLFLLCTTCHKRNCKACLGKNLPLPSHSYRTTLMTATSVMKCLSHVL